MTEEAEKETLQRMSDELDEVITSFAETYAQMAELLRLLPRTLRRSEEDLARARGIRSVRL
jgi:ATP-dependent protease HslVU (ClpYQ) peptidase subunit